ncbi:MAG: glycosyltransferase family 4 protein [Tepidisphaeraceae bacterium]|jgi:glycosyltransferase involved in cell wall biosynthesis
MKVVICWADVAGYTAACWRTLSRRPNVDLFVVSGFAGGDNANAPFGASLMDGLQCRMLTMQERENADLVGEIVAAQKPDVVAVCGWFIRSYTRLAFDPRLAGARFVMGIDTPFQNTWRQWLGRLRMGRFFNRLDRVMVAGERSFVLARHLGIPEEKIRRGNYGIDYDLFHQVMRDREAGGRDRGWPRRFLFVGRYVPVKGIPVMLEAYRQYRSGVSDPWPLTCCGKGPIGGLLGNAQGVTDAGFKQPAELQSVFRDHSVLILPSLFEPWGQVIVEAGAAGMPAIATEACGASVELIRSYYSGLTVPTGRPQPLARAMRWMHDSGELLPEMGRRGAVMAGAYSADCWAERWHTAMQEVLRQD